VKAAEGERGMSSVAMRARKGKQKRETAKPEGEPRARERGIVREKKAEEGHEGEQMMRKGIYLSALIFVEGEGPAARDFAGPAKAAVKDALARAFEGEHDGLTMRLKGLEARTDVEEDDGEGEQKEEEQFEF
jgi:hypothetical protein